MSRRLIGRQRAGSGGGGLRAWPGVLAGIPLLVLVLSATKLPAVAQAPGPLAPPEPAVVAAQLANQVYRSLPEPDIHMNPDPAESDPLVNLPTWLWVSPQS